MSTRYDRNDNYNVVLSNQTILILCTIGFASLGIAVYFLILRHVPSSSDDNGDEALQDYDEFLDQSDVGALNRAERRARAKLRMKKARRANVPTAAQRNVDDADGNIHLAADVPIDAAEDAGLSRKERQRAAKALEREERKMSAEVARARREAEEKKRPKTKSNLREDDTKTLRLHEIFPQRAAGSTDPLSNHLFHESITRKYIGNPQQFLADSMDSKILTVRTFINKLQDIGYLSVTALADEFGISVEEVYNEINSLNKMHGVIGLFDKGNIVYITKEMIEMAVELGNKEGKILHPMNLDRS